MVDVSSKSSQARYDPLLLLPLIGELGRYGCYIKDHWFCRNSRSKLRVAERLTLRLMVWGRLAADVLVWKYRCHLDRSEFEGRGLKERRLPHNGGQGKTVRSDT